jgi:hypothetical protein
MSNCIPATLEHFLSVHIGDTCAFRGMAWKCNGELALQTQTAFNAGHMVIKHEGQGPLAASQTLCSQLILALKLL